MRSLLTSSPCAKSAPKDAPGRLPSRPPAPAAPSRPARRAAEERPVRAGRAIALAQFPGLLCGALEECRAAGGPSLVLILGGALQPNMVAHVLPGVLAVSYTHLRA